MLLSYRRDGLQVLDSKSSISKLLATTRTRLELRLDPLWGICAAKPSTIRQTLREWEKILLPTIFQMCSIDFQGLFQLLSEAAGQKTCDPQGRMGSRATPEKTCDGQRRVASRAESENCVRCAGTGWLTGRDEGKRAMLRDGLARGPRRRKTCDAQGRLVMHKVVVARSPC
jgi:hypothetical protein